MKLLLAIDDSKCAEAAIRAVISQFRPEGTQVLVLHVVDWSDLVGNPFPLLGEQPMFTAHEIESLIQAQSKRAHELVKKAADRVGSAGFETSTSIREGEAKTVILDSAAEWEAEIVVVGSHGRKGITRFVLGSVSEAVARYARCSVEIARCATYS